MESTSKTQMLKRKIKEKIFQFDEVPKTKKLMFQSFNKQLYSRSIHWTFLKIGNVSTKKLYMCNLSTRFPFSIKTVLNVVCCLCKNISERLTLLLYTLNAYKQISFHEKNGSVCLSLNNRRKSKQKTSTQTQKLNYKKNILL